jgi:autonomous glycyl radical cofactor GrcA
MMMNALLFPGARRRSLPLLVVSRLFVVFAMLVVGVHGADAQSLTYSRGQNISPAYEGWEIDADGSRHFLFGYMNRNWEEEVDVPVGPDNGFAPGPADQGQPTRFLPRRNRFVFRIPVPKAFTEKDELIWTLTTYGKSEKAYATLRPDYLVDDVVRASETGALGAGTSSPEVRSNKAPIVKIEGSKTLTAKVGQPVTLTAVVTDDGIPKPRQQFDFAAAAAATAAQETGRGAAPGAAPPAAGAATAPAAGAAAAPTAGRGANPLAAAAALGLLPPGFSRNPAMNPPTRITVNKNSGLYLSWFVYRGVAKVSIKPDQIKPWEDTRAGANSPWAPLWRAPAAPQDGKWVATAVFDAPGTYVLRARADDGALLADQEVTVTVTP